MSQVLPDVSQIIEQMRGAMSQLPSAIEKAARADPSVVLEHARSSGFAMPQGHGALDGETRTLIYLAVALATSNHACTKVMVNKARVQGIAPSKLLEAFHIARFAQATQVLGNAEPLFDLIDEQQVLSSMATSE